MLDMFGTPTNNSSDTTSTNSNAEQIDGYEVATEEDMEWLASIL